MKRRIGEIPPDCKHGMAVDWCSLCTGEDRLQSYVVHEDDQCYVPACKRRAKRRIGPVDLCGPHHLDLEKAYVRSTRRIAPFSYRPDIGEEFVYFVRIDQAIKIGFSTNVRQRVKSFASYGQSVEVLAIEWGDRALEKKLHRKFAHLAAPQGTSRELFHPHQDIFDHIASGRKCAWCKNTALPSRVVCGKHESKELYGEEIIGWTNVHAETG